MKKALIASLVALSMSAFLIGCQKAKTDSTDVNQQTSQTTANNTIAQEQENTTPQKENSTTPQKQTNGTDKDNTPKNETKPTSQGIQYKNDKLGFSFTIPNDWKGKYRIEEDNMHISVYFVPKQKTTDSGSGLLFTIINTKSKDFHEGSLDTFPGKKYFEAKGATYFIGGTTDIGFNENHPEYSIYKKLRSEVPNIIKTIK